MLVLITDDVNTADAKGSKRLRKVAKICVNYGQRMQNSVFECLLSPAELCVVKNQLFSIIDESLKISCDNSQLLEKHKREFYAFRSCPSCEGCGLK